MKFKEKIKKLVIGYSIFLKAVFVLVIIGLASQAIALEKQVILVSTEYPPYYGKNLENYGFITEIIIAAFEAVGYEVKVDFLPWERALRSVKNGEYDGVFTMWHRKEREEWFVFSDPLPPNVVGFYKRKKDKIFFKSLEDLKPYRIGIVKGYTNPPTFEKADYLKKESVTFDRQNIAKLIAGRIDLILIDKAVAKYIINTEFPKHINDLEWIEPPLEIISQHIAFSKKSNNYQDKLADFNHGLRQIIFNGTYNKILKKYGFTEYFKNQ